MASKIEINEALTELVTLRDVLRWGISRFNEANLYYGHGTDNAFDETMSLLLCALHLPQNINSSMLDARLTTKERKKVIEFFVKRIAERIPAPYITKKTWFAGIELYVDERVLIPRSPIAELITHEFSPWIKTNHIRRILDLCTGSACIAIACAMAFPEIEVDAIDISEDALEVADRNVKRHGMEKQVHLIKSDLFAALPGKHYDIIISNPPYVSLEEMQLLPQEYHHEPSLGLAAGPEGLDCILQILREAGKHLTPHGILIVEVGNSQLALIEKFPEIPFTWLEFSQGEAEVFLLTASQLQQYHSILNSWK